MHLWPHVTNDCGVNQHCTMQICLSSPAANYTRQTNQLWSKEQSYKAFLPSWKSHVQPCLLLWDATHSPSQQGVPKRRGLAQEKETQDGMEFKNRTTRLLTLHAISDPGVYNSTPFKNPKEPNLKVKVLLELAQFLQWASYITAWRQARSWWIMQYAMMKHWVERLRVVAGGFSKKKIKHSTCKNGDSWSCQNFLCFQSRLVKFPACRNSVHAVSLMFHWVVIFIPQSITAVDLIMGWSQLCRSDPCSAFFFSFATAFNVWSLWAGMLEVSHNQQQ